MKPKDAQDARRVRKSADEEISTAASASVLGKVRCRKHVVVHRPVVPGKKSPVRGHGRNGCRDWRPVRSSSIWRRSAVKLRINEGREKIVET